VKVPLLKPTSIAAAKKSESKTTKPEEKRAEVKPTVSLFDKPISKDTPLFAPKPVEEKKPIETPSKDKSPQQEVPSVNPFVSGSISDNPFLAPKPKSNTSLNLFSTSGSDPAPASKSKNLFNSNSDPPKASNVFQNIDPPKS
jgi:hypothetical protein